MTIARTTRAKISVSTPFMPIDRCICFNVSFETLQSYAAKHFCGLDGLRTKFGCGRV